MTKDRISDAALLELIKKFVIDNPVLQAINCDDEVAKLIGKHSQKPSGD